LSNLHLSEILSSLSLAEDLANGNPMETSIRTAWFASILAKAAGCNTKQVEETSLTTLMRFLGCTSFASEESNFLEDDIYMKRSFAALDSEDNLEILRIGLGYNPPLGNKNKIGTLGKLLVSGKGFFNRLATTHCETGVFLASSLKLPEGTILSLGQIFERYDGKGAPNGLKADEILITAQVANLSYAFEILRQKLGTSMALEVIQKRSGKQFSSSLVNILKKNLSEILNQSEKIFFWDEVNLQLQNLQGADLQECIYAFADFADLKSIYTIQHSRRTAKLGRKMTSIAGLTNDLRIEAEFTACLMNIGMVSVPTGIVEKKGKLSRPERDRIELHPFYTNKILSSSKGLQAFAEASISHHEKIDGSGYHRNKKELSFLESALSIADSYTALTSDRSYRKAYSEKEATRILLEEVNAGKRDMRSYKILLEGIGIKERRDHSNSSNEFGLTEREIEILQILSTGNTNKEIGSALGLSHRTVQNHTIRIYEKMNVKTRTGATLLATQKGLIF
jgi:HD-GYP domain-containing protein (c-di-GMP phosphodiesterase class II)